MRRKWREGGRGIRKCRWREEKEARRSKGELKKREKEEEIAGGIVEEKGKEEIAGGILKKGKNWSRKWWIRLRNRWDFRKKELGKRYKERVVLKM